MNRFQKWALATTIATYMLITIGGLVRASDAGLGCPDWPQCFGKPYPPLTHEELLQRDLPEDMKVEEFSIRLAWIEYTNRLAGSVIGLLVIGTLFTAWRDHRLNRRIMIPVVLAFITVLFNGWMGSVVIESRLKPLIITIHLLLALVQVSLLLYATVSAFYPAGRQEKLPRQRKLLARGALILLFLALIQVGLGADLRGQLELIEEDYPQLERGEWIHQADWVDQVHRSYSWIILIGVLAMGWYVHQRMEFNPALRYATQIAGALVLIQVAAGIGLAYVNLPPPLQVVHLVNASLLIGMMTLVHLLASRLPVREEASVMPAASELQPAGQTSS